MKIKILSVLFAIIFWQISLAQEYISEDSTPEFYEAKVLEILDEGVDEVFGQEQIYQSLKLQLKNGDSIVTEPGDFQILSEVQKAKVGDRFVVKKNNVDTYIITDKYRLNALMYVALIFIFFVIIFGRTKGVCSLLGLAFSVFILVKFIFPFILAGHNPLGICLMGSFFIASISIYLSHGFSKRTSVAVLSTFVSFVFAFLLSVFFVKLTSLFGTGNEAAFYLHIDSIGNINLQGLLLGGIIISTIGILDDVTTTQCATIDEIVKSNPRVPWKNLLKHGMSVGREHIASLINTLALAYVGASLPMLLLYFGKVDDPFWTILNSEFIAEEIVRTLAGSSALVLAVPISTYLAVLILRPKS